MTRRNLLFIVTGVILFLLLLVISFKKIQSGRGVASLGMEKDAATSASALLNEAKQLEAKADLAGLRYIKN